MASLQGRRAVEPPPQTPRRILKTIPLNGYYKSPNNSIGLPNWGLYFPDPPWVRGFKAIEEWVVLGRSRLRVCAVISRCRVGLDH